MRCVQCEIDGDGLLDCVARPDAVGSIGVTVCDSKGRVIKLDRHDVRVRCGRACVRVRVPQSCGCNVCLVAFAGAGARGRVGALAVVLWCRRTGGAGSVRVSVPAACVRALRSARDRVRSARSTVAADRARGNRCVMRRRSGGCRSVRRPACSPVRSCPDARTGPLCVPRTEVAGAGLHYAMANVSTGFLVRTFDAYVLRVGVRNALAALAPAKC